MASKTVSAAEVVALFRRALAEKWGYIWGGTGQVHTQRAQDSATRAQTIRYGQQWVGRRVADCSGLFWWAYKQLGGYMYHGSNTMWNKYSKAKGKLQNSRRTDGQTLKPGSAVFHVKGNDRHHVVFADFRPQRAAHAVHRLLDDRNLLRVLVGRLDVAGQRTIASMTLPSPTWWRSLPLVRNTAVPGLSG